jgi:uncharacterized membrane protein
MKTLIALTLGMVAALFSAGMQERFVGHSSDWVGLLVGVSVAVLVLHRLQIQARHR